MNPPGTKREKTRNQAGTMGGSLAGISETVFGNVTMADSDWGYGLGRRDLSAGMVSKRSAHDDIFSGYSPANEL
jgi:hypothetical protein